MRGNTPNKDLFTYGFKGYSAASIILMSGLLVILSCKAKKQLVINRPVVDTTVAAKPVDTKAAKLNAIRLAQSVFNTFSGKAKTRLDINGDDNDVTLNIRIKRDQKIWVSVTAIAGIEVARALITPDSIMLINRLQSLYVKEPFSYIYQFTGNQVNYKTLQSLLVGNTISELINENADLQSLNGSTTLSGSLEGLIYKVFIGANMKVNQTNLNDQSAGQSLQVINSAFIAAANRVVPSQIDMSSIVKDKKILVNLHYTKVDFDQSLEYPFSIPSRYKPAN